MDTRKFILRLKKASVCVSQNVAAAAGGGLHLGDNVRS